MRVLIVFTLWGSLLGTSPAAAQEDLPSSTLPGAPTKPEDPEAARVARSHFHRGLEHFRARDYREAIREFEMAAAKVPSADLWFNIARAHEELSDYELSIEYYRRYLRDRVDPPDRARVEAHLEVLAERAEVARRAADERPTTGTLRLQSTAENAEVRIDGDLHGRTPIDEPLALSPGAHALEVDREGFIPLRAAPTVRIGATTGAYADLVPKTRYRSVRSKRRLTWLAVGLSAAALGAAIGFGVRAASLHADERFDDARRVATYSDYSLGGALGLGVVAAILWFVEGRSIGSERLTP